MIEGHQPHFRVFRGSNVWAASLDLADTPIHLPESR